jgi:hypothetical protein
MRKDVIPASRIADAIQIIRGQKVMLDSDLASLYGVATKALNQAVGRNRDRFPRDFMFQLTPDEARNWSQSVTSSRKHRGATYRPYAFTEQGVAMLSSVLRSKRAVEVNVAIMRAFVQLREAIETSRELAKKFAELEQRVGAHDGDIAAIIDAIRQLMAPAKKPPREIGFHVRETPPRYGTWKRR